MIYTILEYVRPDGTSPFGAWFDGLSAEAATKIVKARIRLEQGNLSAVKWMGALGEYRIDWGPGLRIYLARDGDHILVLFGGGTKQRQQKDIERAKSLLAAYKLEKNNLKRRH